MSVHDLTRAILVIAFATLLMSTADARRRTKTDRWEDAKKLCSKKFTAKVARLMGERRKAIKCTPWIGHRFKGVRNCTSDDTGESIELKCSPEGEIFTEAPEVDYSAACSAAEDISANILNSEQFEFGPIYIEAGHTVRCVASTSVDDLSSANFWAHGVADPGNADMFVGETVTLGEGIEAYVTANGYYDGTFSHACALKIDNHKCDPFPTDPSTSVPEPAF
eukprot:m.352572 g.352572  ORF g.352572 m.352572 type:complete len:222 (-) comp16554_c0_seq1:241-906(-)